ADAQLGAVQLAFSPAQVTLQPGATQKVTVRVTVDGSKLDAWPFDSVGPVGSGAALNGPEFDGWVTATSGSEQVHLGWTVLPRKATDVSEPDAVKVNRAGDGTVTLKNRSSVAAGWTEVFALTGTSPVLPQTAAGGPGSNEPVIDLAASGVYVDAGIVQFAVATHSRRTVLPYPAEFDVYVDVDMDGTDDFVIWNQENGGFAATGETIVYVRNLHTAASGAYY